MAAVCIHVRWKLTLQVAHETLSWRNRPMHSLPETEKIWTILNRPTLISLCFYGDVRWNNFFLCRHNILTEGLFVTQLAINGEISISRTVWVTTNCRFMSEMFRMFFRLYCLFPIHRLLSWWSNAHIHKKIAVWILTSESGSVIWRSRS